MGAPRAPRRALAHPGNVGYWEAKMGIHIYGNDPNQTLTVASGDISGNLVIFGNGVGDNVLAENGNIIQNIIAFGNGVGDHVESTAGAISNDIITFSDVAGGPPTLCSPPAPS